MSATLDALDVDLLALAQSQSRTGVLELARTLGVARGTVQARLDRLEREGVVTGWGPEVDVAAAGFGVQAFVTLEIAQGDLEEVTSALHDDPAVLEAYVTTGTSDVQCRLAAASHEDLQDALLALNRLAAVRRSTSVMVLSVLVEPRTLPLLASTPRRAPSRVPTYRDDAQPPRTS